MSLEICVRNLCDQIVREAVLESEMDQMENELFSYRRQGMRRSTSTPPPPLTPPMMLAEAVPPYTPPKPQKILLATPQPTRARKQHQTLCQAICATTLEQFPSLIRNPQLLLSLTVQQTLSVQSMLETGDYDPEDESEDMEPGVLPTEVLVSPGSTIICREQIGYDLPVQYGPLENYSDAQVHYDMIPRVEWNVMIPGLQARPCFLKRVRKIPKHQQHYKTRHEELLARRPISMVSSKTRLEDEQEFIVTSSPDPLSGPCTPTRARLPSKPKKEVTNVKRDLFERIVTSLMQHLPTYTRSAVIKLVRDVREKKGGLSGHSTEEIVRGVLEYERLNRR